MDNETNSERQSFVERFSEEFRGRYRRLIMLVGFSPEPLIRSILSIRPEKVCFIHTRETEKQIDGIVEETGLRPSQFRREQVDGSRPDEIYDVIKDYIQRWGKETGQREMAVDITGGKKAMVGGAAIAASFYGVDIVYSDYTEYDDKTRRPVPGSEVLMRLENPFERTMDVRMGIARRLFNAGDFKQSGRLYDEMKEKASDPVLTERLALYQNLAAAYNLWWNLNFSKAASKMSDVVRKLEKYGEIGTELDRERLDAQSVILTELKEAEKADNFSPGEPAVMRHMTGTLMAMVKLNEREGNLTEEALRLYRVCELISQHRLLSEYGLDTSNLNWAKVNEDVIKRFQEISFETLKKAKKAGRMRGPGDIRIEGRFKIGLMEGYSLLKALNDPLVEELDILKHQSALDFRNNSYLAHGLEPVEGKGVKNLKEIVMGLLLRLYSLNGWADEERELHRELERYCPVEIKEK